MTTKGWKCIQKWINYYRACIKLLSAVTHLGNKAELLDSSPFNLNQVKKNPKVVLHPPPKKSYSPASMRINLKFLTQPTPCHSEPKTLPNHQVTPVTKLLRLPIPPSTQGAALRYIGILGWGSGAGLIQMKRLLYQSEWSLAKPLCPSQGPAHGYKK